MIATRERGFTQRKPKRGEERGMKGSLAIGVITIAMPAGSSMAQDRDRLEAGGFQILDVTSTGNRGN